ncbi:chloramphenicol acetyltransferase [Bartonella henselae]|uniref:Chloramphenicol acetyltransferase n=1 Tax=Bartonella henselae TaxID=38323 RepID=X5M007_BARHN|nr:DapH/DapD/GlmU-related protein [Bartonella henselae]MDM9996506.1 DapH/DapD/GlmU-related protein [Bartonella henselae]OLL49023.1 chloramphenicol acetyltransferase [Bartonella henselae]OLL49505.1 chloramphenicol acetyltransferase [Bartonella henselae]OLL50789.1 chloramphenicol acetyltransferase [Bartonella henselae]OLL58641.1 chloramphenicol acetyltransferase [Bartonella henselae]
MNTKKDLRFRESQPRINTTARLHGCKLGRYVEINERVVLRDVTVGDFSYFEHNSEAIYSDIGRFCSIASHVCVNALEHPMERLSTHKITYRPNEYFRYMSLDRSFRERRCEKRVTVGHDVWIGHGAVIMPGVAIGHGAIIGTNAVITKDILPYTIVAGVPAKPLRMRFPDNVIQTLLEMAWWNWPLDKIYNALPDMQNLPIEVFIHKWK